MPDTSPLAKYMSLRDEFAGRVATGIMASFTKDTVGTDEKVAELAYAVADAMLKERQK